MASLAELQDALVNADKAGDFDAARQLADAIHGMRSVQDAKPTAVKAGGALNDIGRQVGLTARYGIEGLGNTAQILSEPIRYVTDRLTGQTGKTKPAGAIASEFSDLLGLPKPQGANERVAGEAAKLGFGTLGMAGPAQYVAAKSPQVTQFLSQNVPGAVSGATNAVRSFAANPVQQVSSAVGAGLAGGSSKEAGGSWWQQLIASLAGGLAGGMAPAGASMVADKAKGAFNALKAEIGAGMTPQQMDAKISIILQQSGVDYSQVPERVRQGMRTQLQSALEANKETDPAAVRRLLDFTTTGTTPTRGMVSQDPVQITKEMNLAKTAANTSDGELHGLPRLQNQNNARLIANLNESGAAKGDLFRAGETAVGSIGAKDVRAKSLVDDLYERARAMPGGDTQLERKPLVDNIYRALAESNKLAFLPKEVSAMIDTISKGQVTVNGQTFRVPYDAKALDSLMTTVATAQRSTTDGNVKAALSAVRNAIEATGVAPLKTAYGGNQVTTPATAQAMQNADAQAGSFMDALNSARGAAKARFGWQESAPPIEAALGGAQPDKFISKFVIGGSVADAKAVAKNVPGDEVKNAIVAHLKEKSLNSASDEVGKFSQSAYNKALAAIGDRKLEVFFSPQEIGQLKAVGRVASYMQVQPVGSAVNNSNSAAMLVGKAYDALRGGVGMLPGVGPVGAGLLDLTIGTPTKNAASFLAQRNAQNVLPGLLAQQQKGNFVDGMMLPGVAMGGLLSAP